jgi:hypothetical protein
VFGVCGLFAMLWQINDFSATIGYTKKETKKIGAGLVLLSHELPRPFH